MSLFSGASWTKVHEIKHGDKTDLLIEKKQSGFGRIISLPNAENSAKIR